MNNNNSTTPRVVRTGPKTTNKRSRKKPSSPTVKKMKRAFAVIGKVLLTTILVLTITGCIVGTALTIYVTKFIDSGSVIDLSTLKLSFTGTIFAKDKDGKDVEVQNISNGENRVWVDYEKVPQDLKDAIVYAEDARFWTHSGVDFKRTFGAFFGLLIGEKGFGGGSTIAQQLIKNYNGDINNRTIEVKIKEIITAMNLDKNNPKETILEAYMNYIALHYNTYGVQAGAKLYFNKDVSELNLEECAALAVISKSPATCNPIQNPARNKERRQYALKQMLKYGAITQEEFDKAYNADLKLAGDKNNDHVKDDNVKTTGPVQKVQSYFIDSVIDEVVNDLMVEKGYNKSNATQKLYSQGFKIYTSMEIETQKILENYFENPANFKFKGEEAKSLQAYMSIMNYDGNIVATVGGRGKKEGNRILNRAVSSKRPAGSTMKPLGVYAPAFEQNLINWSTVMEDSAVQKVKDPETGEERDWPSNYEKRYEGPVTIIDALRVSKNTIPVRIVNALTPQNSFDFVYNKLNLKSLIPTGKINNVNPASLALGDGGITVNELVAAYQIFGNGGYYIQPKMYTKVKDGEGKVILDTTTRERKQVISGDTAYIMNKGLWNVVDNGTGKYAKLSNWETVGKTGTSNDRKDLLFMGLTPYYVAGIRYGFDDNKLEINQDRSGGYGHHLKTWKNVMEQVHKGRNKADFELDGSNVVELEFCKETGLLAQSGCPKKETGYYKKNSLPDVCSLHGSTAP
ncbi:transglycosylase domain-containing protein [Paludicola sp. MB14-C6]|uniref:transglycosylase domain-containing protein n=1 Tax=Paludihabitans sp. MB14-C6 TaxID=3070656 RepID=UPI0027DB7907|nr:transglycosylase domain-containing protein [Paludicola sp. MB14-C6]WMJ22601.1 transglycosylase domain-containing protein [Paludicola sp. MB14-C6]